MIARGLKRRTSQALARLRRSGPAVCDDLSSWAAATPGAERWVLDGAFTTSRPLPRTIEARVDPSFSALRSFPVPERALVKIPHALLRSAAAPPDREVGLVILPTGEYVGELVALTPKGRRSMLRPEPSYREPLPSRVDRKRGNFHALLGFGVRHYYHWCHDLVMGSRGIAARLPPDTQLITPENLRPFQLETLALLGFDEQRLLPFPSGSCWELENLYVVTPRLKTQIDHPEPFRWFRDAAKSRYAIPESPGGRRLYLSRRLDGHWRTVNEPEVERFLAGHGFETVTPGTMSFRAQIELFGQAEVIVGTGAGLFNMVFSPPGTRILQFQERGHIVHALWTAAAAMGFDYHYFLCERVPNPNGGLADIRVPVHKLEESLWAMGLRP